MLESNGKKSLGVWIIQVSQIWFAVTLWSLSHHTTPHDQTASPPHHCTTTPRHISTPPQHHTTATPQQPTPRTTAPPQPPRTTAPPYVPHHCTTTQHTTSPHPLPHSPTRTAYLHTTAPPHPLPANSTAFCSKFAFAWGVLGDAHVLLLRFADGHPSKHVFLIFRNVQSSGGTRSVHEKRNHAQQPCSQCDEVHFEILTLSAHLYLFCNDKTLSSEFCPTGRGIWVMVEDNPIWSIKRCSLLVIIFFIRHPHLATSSLLISLSSPHPHRTLTIIIPYLLTPASTPLPPPVPSLLLLV